MTSVTNTGSSTLDTTARLSAPPAAFMPDFSGLPPRCSAAIKALIEAAADNRETSAGKKVTGERILNFIDDLSGTLRVQQIEKIYGIVRLFFAPDPLPVQLQNKFAWSLGTVVMAHPHPPDSRCHSLQQQRSDFLRSVSASVGLGDILNILKQLNQEKRLCPTGIFEFIYRGELLSLLTFDQKMTSFLLFLEASEQLTKISTNKWSLLKIILIELCTDEHKRRDLAQCREKIGVMLCKCDPPRIQANWKKKTNEKPSPLHAALSKAQLEVLHQFLAEAVVLRENKMQLNLFIYQCCLYELHVCYRSLSHDKIIEYLREARGRLPQRHIFDNSQKEEIIILALELLQFYEAEDPQHSLLNLLAREWQIDGAWIGMIANSLSGLINEQKLDIELVRIHVRNGAALIAHSPPALSRKGYEDEVMRAIALKVLVKLEDTKLFKIYFNIIFPCWCGNLPAIEIEFLDVCRDAIIPFATLISCIKEIWRQLDFTHPSYPQTLLSTLFEKGVNQNVLSSRELDFLFSCVLEANFLDCPFDEGVLNMRKKDVLNVMLKPFKLDKHSWYFSLTGDEFSSTGNTPFNYYFGQLREKQMKVLNQMHFPAVDSNLPLLYFNIYRAFHNAVSKANEITLQTNNGNEVKSDKLGLKRLHLHSLNKHRVAVSTQLGLAKSEALAIFNSISSTHFSTIQDGILECLRMPLETWGVYSHYFKTRGRFGKRANVLINKKDKYCQGVSKLLEDFKRRFSAIQLNRKIDQIEENMQRDMTKLTEALEKINQIVSRLTLAENFFAEADRTIVKSLEERYKITDDYQRMMFFEKAYPQLILNEGLVTYAALCESRPLQNPDSLATKLFTKINWFYNENRHLRILEEIAKTAFYRANSNRGL